VARLAGEVTTDRRGGKRVVALIPRVAVGFIVVIAAVFTYLYFRKAPPPRDVIDGYIKLIPAYKSMFAEAMSDGLHPGDVHVIARIMRRLDDAKKKSFKYAPEDEVYSLAKEHSRKAVELEVEMLRAVRTHLSAAVTQVTKIRSLFSDETSPHRIKDYYDRVKVDFSLLKAFGWASPAASAKSLIHSLADHYKFCSALFSYQSEVDDLFRQGVGPRNIWRAKKIVGRLERFVTGVYGEERAELFRAQVTLVSDLRKYVLDRLDREKIRARQRVDLIVAAYPKENDLGTLYEYRGELSDLRGILKALDVTEEAEELVPALASLGARIKEYEEIETAERALAEIRGKMTAFDEGFDAMLVDDLSSGEAEKCVAMLRALEDRFVVFRQGEEEGFKAAHPNILLMQSLHKRITKEIEARAAYMAEKTWQIRQAYSKSRDIEHLRQQVTRMKGYLRLFKAMGKKYEALQARQALRDLAKRIDFLAHYDERMEVLEVAKAELQSLRLKAEEMFRAGLTSDEVPPLNKVRRQIDKYKKYDPWCEGGNFREQVEVAARVEALIRQTLEEKARWVREFRVSFWRVGLDSLERTLPNAEETAELFAALKRDDLEEEALGLIDDMTGHIEFERQLKEWRKEFTTYKEAYHDMIGRSIYGLQAGEVKKLMKRLRAMQGESIRLIKASKDEDTNKVLVSVQRTQLEKLTGEISQAIEERCDEAETHYKEIDPALPAVGNLGIVRDYIAQLKDDYGVLKVRRPKKALPVKSVLNRAKRRYRELKKLHGKSNSGWRLAHASLNSAAVVIEFAQTPDGLKNCPTWRAELAAATLLARAARRAPGHREEKAARFGARGRSSKSQA